MHLSLKLLLMGFLPATIAVTPLPEGHPILPYLRTDVPYYEKLMRPFSAAGGPVNITINLYVRDLEPINVEKEEMTIQLTFRQLWNDPRLAHDQGEKDFITMVGSESSKLWLPDTFFRQSRSTLSHGIMDKERYARVYKTGDVLLSSRVTTTIACPGVKQSWTTFGNASCSLHIASYAFTVDDILYHLQETDPVQVSRTVPVHTVVSDHLDIKTAAGTYSVVTMDITVMSKMYVKLASSERVNKAQQQVRNAG